MMPCLTVQLEPYRPSQLIMRGWGVAASKTPQRTHTITENEFDRDPSTGPNNRVD
ncbi:hypothetical protein ABID62_001042 [Bradyrhizobium sp. S3.9.1]